MTDQTPIARSRSLLAILTQHAADFAAEVLGLPTPDRPTRLLEQRKAWAVTAITEELDEFRHAESLEDEVDALVDLSYFALGRINEMGISPRAVFEEVHIRNMGKERGELSKRPGAMGYDAVKPDGWTGPDYSKLLLASRDQVLRASAASGSGLPRVLVLGHARHGKDTVCERLRDVHGFRFTSSSAFCAERVIAPALDRLASRHLAAGGRADEFPYPGPYVSLKDMYADRVNHRAFWFDTIAAYCSADGARLAREIFADNDIYCGMRNMAEFCAARDAGVFDVVVWVDASARMPREGADSCSVTIDLADIIVDNNRGLEDLNANVDALAALLKTRKVQ